MMNPEIHLINQVSWDEQPAYTDIDRIGKLGLEEANLRFASQGQMVEVGLEDEVTGLVSHDFAKCAAIIMRSSVEGEWALAHAQPLDSELYHVIRDKTTLVDEALFVFGSMSVNQYSIGELLKGRGTKVRTLHVETGRTSFSLAFDIPSLEVTIARKTPDQSLLTYKAFEGKV